MAGTRHRDWPGFSNARALEGLQTSFGPIGRGRLYRSDEPRGEPDAITAALRAEGVSTVLDLRSASETRRRPSVLAGDGIYDTAPMVDPRMDHLRDPASERTLLDLYVGSIERNGRTITEGLKRIAHAPVGGVLLHCAAGKDRTGILVAVALSLMGAAEEEIIEDYAHSQARLGPYFIAELAMTVDDDGRRRLASRQHSSPQTMAGLLGHLQSRLGGARAYVKRRGLSDADMDLLAHRLTAPPPATA